MFSQASHNSRTTPIEPIAGDETVVVRAQELIADLKPDRVDLLKALHRLQHEFGHVPRAAIPLLAGQFKTTPAIVYGTIDFYSEVRIEPPPKDSEAWDSTRERGIYGKLALDHAAEEIVEWCSGPACLLKGSVQIRRALEAVLGCEMNSMSGDGKFGLRLVQCDGTCDLAPLVRHKGKYIGPLSVSDAIALARDLKGEPSLEERVAAAQEQPAEDDAAEEKGE